MVPSLSEG